MSIKVIENTFTENGYTCAIFQENREILTLYWTNWKIQEQANALAQQQSLYQSNDGKYYCDEQPTIGMTMDSSGNIVYQGYVYKKININQNYDITTKVYVGKISLSSSAYPNIYYVSEPKLIYLHSLQYDFPSIFSPSTLAQGNKILASDIQDITTRLQLELQRRNKGYDLNADGYFWTQFPEYYGTTPGGSNALTPVNSTLPSVSVGGKALASDINKFVAELENINSNNGWSNTTAVNVSSIIETIINISQSLNRFEKGVDTIPYVGVVDNKNHNITTNTSGCASYCRGLCQSCLGGCTGAEESGSSGGSGSNCPGDCTGAGCTGGCNGTCGSICTATGTPLVPY